jgi:protein-disulfide isomerase
MSARGWIIFGVICVVLFGGLIFWSGRDRVDVSKVDTNTILAGSAASGNIGDRTFGNKDAKVMLVEYGDFQCPGCGSAHPIVKALTEKYKDKLVFVFRNFPLTSIHPNARAAAAAAETAGQLGNYWEMHNILYENQDDWSSSSTDNRASIFADYAQRVGLNKKEFTAKLNDTTNVSKKVNFDMALGRKLNINGTPTFYLDGKKLAENQYNGQDTFEKTLLAEFKKQGVTVTQSTTNQ